jgi:hypothetical protein
VIHPVSNHLILTTNSGNMNFLGTISNPSEEKGSAAATPNPSNSSQPPSNVKKIIIQRLLERADNQMVKKVLEQLLYKYGLNESRSQSADLAFLRSFMSRTFVPRHTLNP